MNSRAALVCLWCVWLLVAPAVHGRRIFPDNKEKQPSVAPSASVTSAASSTQSSQRYFKDADRLHRPTTPDERIDVIANFPTALIMSAPGHHNLRNPEKVLERSKAMIAKGSGEVFDDMPGGKRVDKIVLNVFTAQQGSHVVVRSVEAMDGNHRLAAGLHAKMWKIIGDIPKRYLDIRVNGFDTNGKQHPRWIPLDVAKKSPTLQRIDVPNPQPDPFPKDKWFEVPSDWGAKGPTAQVSGEVSSIDDSIPAEYRGVPMEEVLKRSLERIKSAGDTK